MVSSGVLPRLYAKLTLAARQPSIVAFACTRCHRQERLSCRRPARTPAEPDAPVARDARSSAAGRATDARVARATKHARSSVSPGSPLARRFFFFVSMAGARLLRAVLLLLLARGRPTHAFSHPRRSDVYGSGADTLVEDHREYDDSGELVHVNENDASYADAAVSSPDAWSRANDARRAAVADATARARTRGSYPNAEARVETRALPRGVYPGHAAVEWNRAFNAFESKPVFVTRVAPRTGPTRGGTAVAVDGGPFKWPAPTGRETCRFFHVFDRPANDDVKKTSAFASDAADAFGYSDVPATVLSRTRVECVTPARLNEGVVAVAVSADGVVFSADSPATATARGDHGGFAFFEYVDGPPAGFFRADNATGAYGGGTVVTVTVNRAAPTRATRATSHEAFGATRLELDDPRVVLTLANGTTVPSTFLAGINESRAFVDGVAARARNAYVSEYDGASVSVAAVRDVVDDAGDATPPSSVPLGALRVAGELVNGTDGIGYALVPAELVRLNVTFVEHFNDTEPARAYRPFQPSEFITCEFAYDHLGPHDAVFNLTGETRLNASEIRARAAGTFYGDCHADCVMDAELVNHVEFLGNFSWRGNCSIPVVNLTALNVTIEERIKMFGERWDPYDAPRVDFFGDADEGTNFSDAKRLTNCSWAPFIPARRLRSKGTWLGYDRVACPAPQQTMPPRNTTFGPNVTDLRTPTRVRVSHDGVAFSSEEEAFDFTYVKTSPDVFHAFTRQVAGFYRARGPFSGNTEVYLNGTGFVPSDHIRARFSPWTLNATLHYNVNRTKETGRCFFDTPEQIRCHTPRWYPYEEYYEWQKGGYEPCFKTYVDVSNDGGLTWTAPRRSETNMFFYCPIYVSPFGHNQYGRGTPMLPYRDVSRAIEATLSHPRAYVTKKGFDYPRKRGVYDQTLPASELAGRAARFGENGRGRGFGEYVNHDQIVLLPGPYEDKDEIDGRYGPERNMNLDPGGRVLEIVSAGAAWFSGRGSSDGFGSELDVLRPTHAAGADKNERDAEQKGVLYAHVVAFTNGRTRWETFETRGASTGNGSDAFVIAALNVSGAEAEAGNRRRLLAALKENADAPRAADDADADAEVAALMSRMTREGDFDVVDDATKARRERLARERALGAVAARRDARREKDAHAASADAASYFSGETSAAARRRRYQGSRA